jgi:hypothetical protein
VIAWPANHSRKRNVRPKQMKITVSHHRPKEEVVRSVDRSFHDLFQGIGVLPIQLVQEHRSWQGSTLTFVLTAKMGPISTPIKGTVEVTDRDLTIDVNLGILERVIPTKKAQEVITDRVRGLLK